MLWISLTIVGIGIGFLAGLSVSPVLSIVLTSLVGAAATITAVFGNFGDRDTTSSSKQPKLKINPQPGPLALLVVTLVIGALIGLVLRVNIATSRQASRMRGIDLAPPATISESIQSWVALGLNKTEVTQHLFDAYLGITISQAEKTADQTSRAATVGLFAVSADECARYRYIPFEKLRMEMQAGSSDALARIAEKITDEEVLRLITDIACGRKVGNNE